MRKKVLRQLVVISGYRRIATVIGKTKECSAENRNTSSVRVGAEHQTKYKMSERVEIVHACGDFKRVLYIKSQFEITEYILNSSKLSCRFI